MDETTPIIVEFSPRVGGQMVVSLSPADLVARSNVAVSKALEIVRDMGSRFIGAIDTAANRPSSVEIEFSLKFEVEAGAIIARTSQEASINVKLTWERRADPKSE